MDIYCLQSAAKRMWLTSHEVHDISIVLTREHRVCTPVFTDGIPLAGQSVWRVTVASNGSLLLALQQGSAEPDPSVDPFLSAIAPPAPLSPPGEALALDCLPLTGFKYSCTASGGVCTRHSMSNDCGCSQVVLTRLPEKQSSCALLCVTGATGPATPSPVGASKASLLGSFLTQAQLAPLLGDLELGKGGNVGGPALTLLTTSKLSLMLGWPANCRCAWLQQVRQICFPHLLAVALLHCWKGLIPSQ